MLIRTIGIPPLTVILEDYALLWETLGNCFFYIFNSQTPSPFELGNHNSNSQHIIDQRQCVIFQGTEKTEIHEES